MVCNQNHLRRRLGFRNRGSRRGVAAVEGTLVLFVFLVILFALLDLGLLVLDYNLLNESARQLSRSAMIHGSKATPLGTMWGPTSVSGTASDGSAYSQSIQKLLGTLVPSRLKYTIQWPAGTNTPGDQVQVTMTYTYQPMIPFVLGNSAITLQAASTMRVGH